MNTIQTTEVFDAWFAGLKDRQAMRRVQVRIDRAEDGNFGDCAPVGEGVSEMRIHYGPIPGVFRTARRRSLSCWRAAINLHNQKTSKPRWKSRGNFRRQTWQRSN
jgi:putative addiction module killer protein